MHLTKFCLFFIQKMALEDKLKEKLHQTSYIKKYFKKIWCILNSCHTKIEVFWHFSHLRSSITFEPFIRSTWNFQQSFITTPNFRKINYFYDICTKISNIIWNIPAPVYWILICTLPYMDTHTQRHSQDQVSIKPCTEMKK